MLMSSPDFDGVWTKERYSSEVKNWAMLLLEVLRPLPNTTEKVTLLLQVDKLKYVAPTIKVLPAFVGAIAVISSKATNLLEGKPAPGGYTREDIIALVRSKSIRRLLARDQDHFNNLKNLLDIRPKDNRSATLNMLSKGGS